MSSPASSNTAVTSVTTAVATTAANVAATTSLIIPGLVWPVQALADLTQGLPLPALTRLLGSGTLSLQPTISTDNAIAQHLGLPHDCAGAALRREALGLGLGLNAQGNTNEQWICLDPVNLGFVERRMLVGDPQELSLTRVEAEALAASIGPVVSALGVIEVATPHQWHLRLAPGGTVPATEALSSVIAKRADASLAALDSRWQQALNDAQIELHSHPVNKAREGAGRPTVNSLWPWGGAPLPARPKISTKSTSPQYPPPVTLYANAPEHRGLAAYLNLPGAPVAECWSRTLAAPALFVLDSLALPARRADANRWREALILMEQSWFAPLLADLEQGHIKHLRIEFIGAPHGWTLSVSRMQLRLARLAFWHTPQGIAQLALTVQNPSP